jgi:hypothetical protein
MSRKDLEFVLDYILNKADEPEFEVIKKACARRVKDKQVFAGLGGEGPGAMAKRMSKELQDGVGASMESIRGTVRGFIAEMVRKEMPEVDEAQLAAYLDEVAPPPGAKRKGANAAASKIPPAALLEMVTSFVDYSTGGMAPSRQEELWSQNPRWQDEYWALFPAELKALVKAYLDGQIDADTFGSALLSVLGL